MAKQIQMKNKLNLYLMKIAIISQTNNRKNKLEEIEIAQQIIIIPQ